MIGYFKRNHVNTHFHLLSYVPLAGRTLVRRPAFIGHLAGIMGEIQMIKYGNLLPLAITAK
jgi:hypothetical protein